MLLVPYAFTSQHIFFFFFFHVGLKEEQNLVDCGLSL